MVSTDDLGTPSQSSSPEPSAEPDVGPDAQPDNGPESRPEAPPVPLLTLRDPLPPVVDTEERLLEVCAGLSAGTGPVGIDAERASGYRYSSRAYLIQLRREGTTTSLIDPIAFDSLDPLAEALSGTEWILHAATQDLPCLTELGLHPDALFDTELAGRLLGYPRVGLATLVETVLGFRLKKEHSAADWSTRPLPSPWLEYAALDVEVLAELREALGHELAATGKDEWARQEFDHLRGFQLHPRAEPWRRTSGLHRIRNRHSIAAVRALWEARDELARKRDVTPSRLIPDTAIVAAATALPGTREQLLATPGFRGRAAERYASRWTAALREAAALDESELPERSPRTDAPPTPRIWADRDPVAARRLQAARTAMTDLAEQHRVPVENLLTPDYLRRVLWKPPTAREPGRLLDQVTGALQELGARGWQIALTAPVLTSAIITGEAPETSHGDESA